MISPIIAAVASTGTSTAAAPANRHAALVKRRPGFRSSNHARYATDTAQTDTMPVDFQYASGAGVAHVPTDTSKNPSAAAAIPATPTNVYLSRWTNAAGANASKQKPPRDSAVSRSRPLVLVYSPSKAMANTTSTAAASEANSATNIAFGAIRMRRGPATIQFRGGLSP